ncbi:MAG: inositol monophosphatase [Pseudomonadota bacterium]
MIETIERQKRFEFGRGLIREAGALAFQYFLDRSSLQIEEKGPQDLVSRADREVEDLIRERVASQFPGDLVVGEEAGGEIGDAFWIVDPIDGTSNFLRGFPYWCVAIAYVEDTRATLAFTFDPVGDVLYLAQHGQGASRNGRSVGIRERPTDQSCLALAYSSKQDIESYLQVMHSLTANQIEHRRLGSIALSLALLAEGVFDGVVTASTNSWDVIGGLLLAEEAGALITPFQPKVAMSKRQPIAAATQSLVPVVSEISGLTLIHPDGRPLALESA